MKTPESIPVSSAASVRSAPRRLTESLAILSGLAITNGSFLLGWGGSGFYAVPHQLAVAVLLSLEVILARRLENTHEGVKTVPRQAWAGLCGPLWIALNTALAWSARTGAYRLPAASAGMSWAGLACFAAGLGLRMWSARTLGRFFSLHVTVFPRHRLVTGGPYAFCRHPAYLGTLLQVVALSLVFHSAIGAFALAAFVPVLWWRIRDEDNLLKETFGNVFLHYKEAVRSLIPSWRPFQEIRANQ